MSDLFIRIFQKFVE